MVYGCHNSSIDDFTSFGPTSADSQATILTTSAFTIPLPGGRMDMDDVKLPLLSLTLSRNMPFLANCTCNSPIESHGGLSYRPSHPDV
jgi:hypothetical protein